MDKKINIMFVFLYILFIPMAEGAVPGTFFWKPRLGLDLSVPTTEYAARVAKPNKENIHEGIVVLIDGYSAGLSVISLAAGVSNHGTMLTLNPVSAYFYTNTYRWGLRHLSLIPFWMGGSGGHYCETHKVWRRRFFYMDEFVPSWLKSLLFYVDKSEWKKEEDEFKRFKKIAEPAFGKHYRYPNKNFNKWRSEQTTETLEDSDMSSSSSEQNKDKKGR